MHSIIKSTFYIAFIIISFLVASNMLVFSKGNRKVKIFGSVVLLLAIGESFHLVPRILEIFTSGAENYVDMIETGRFIASLSIVLVYILLYWFWKVYNEASTSSKLDIVLVILGMISLSLSVILQSSSETIFIFFRNLPMLVIGAIVVFHTKKRNSKAEVQPFRFLWLALLLSLLFTIGFELLSIPYPFFIILMMPKTLMHIWLVVMGYIAYKKDLIWIIHFTIIDIKESISYFVNEECFSV